MSILDFVRTVDPAKPPKLNGVRTAEQAAPQAMPFQSPVVGPNMGNQIGSMTQQTADFLRDNPAAGQKLSDGQALRSQWLSTPEGQSLADGAQPTPSAPMNGTFSVLNTSEGAARQQRALDIYRSMADMGAPAASPLPKDGMRARPALAARNSSFGTQSNYSAPARLSETNLGDTSSITDKYWR
jgi:hypothetical protein